jgi:hypothetical protein
MKVLLNSMSGKSLSLDVLPSDTFEDLQARFCQKTGCLLDLQHFKFKDWKIKAQTSVMKYFQAGMFIICFVVVNSVDFRSCLVPVNWVQCGICNEIKNKNSTMFPSLILHTCAPANPPLSCLHRTLFPLDLWDSISYGKVTGKFIFTRLWSPGVIPPLPHMSSQSDAIWSMGVHLHDILLNWICEKCINPLFL